MPYGCNFKYFQGLTTWITIETLLLLCNTHFVFFFSKHVIKLWALCPSLTSAVKIKGDLALLMFQAIKPPVGENTRCGKCVTPTEKKWGCEWVWRVPAKKKKKCCSKCRGYWRCGSGREKQNAQVSINPQRLGDSSDWDAVAVRCNKSALKSRNGEAKDFWMNAHIHAHPLAERSKCD